MSKGRPLGLLWYRKLSQRRIKIKKPAPGQYGLLRGDGTLVDFEHGEGEHILLQAPAPFKDLAQTAIESLLPPPMLAAFLMDCLWPDVKIAYRRVDVSARPNWMAFMNTVLSMTTAAIVLNLEHQIDPYPQLTAWVLIRLYANEKKPAANVDRAVEVEQTWREVEQQWGETLVSTQWSGGEALVLDGTYVSHAEAICDRLGLTGTEAREFVYLAVKAACVAGVTHNRMIAPEQIVKFGLQWMCGERADPAHFLASEFRIYGHRENNKFMQWFSDDQLQLPENEPESLRVLGRRYFHHSDGSKNPMYIRAFEASLASEWDTDDNPLQWIAREARNAVDRQIRQDTGSRGDLLNHRHRRFEQIDMADNANDSIENRAFTMDAEAREDLLRSYMRYMRPDARLFFELTKEGLKFQEIILKTSWTDLRAKAAQRAMERTRTRVIRIWRSRPLKGGRVLGIGICKEYLDGNRGPNTGPVWIYAPLASGVRPALALASFKADPFPFSGVMRPLDEKPH